MKNENNLINIDAIENEDDLFDETLIQNEHELADHRERVRDYRSFNRRSY